MKAKSICRKVYDFEINGVLFKGFAKGETWNGITEFKSDEQTILAQIEGSNFDFFNALFDCEIDENKAYVIAASPDIKLQIMNSSID